MTLDPVIPEPPSMFQIDRQARTWLKRLVKVWRGPNPRTYPDPGERVMELFAFEGMSSPLYDDRLDLIYMATARENPRKDAFVTLALVDLVEDSETLPVGDRSAKLPYQLAWARAGYTLSERSGCPGGIHRFRWPDVREASQ